MPVVELDTLIDRLLPQVLADPDLGDGRTFTRLHFSRLWALSCLHAGECYDEDLLAHLVPAHLPSKVLIAREVGGLASL
jgi:hypothetical protein